LEAVRGPVATPTWLSRPPRHKAPGSPLDAHPQFD